MVAIPSSIISIPSSIRSLLFFVIPLRIRYEPPVSVFNMFLIPC